MWSSAWTGQFYFIQMIWIQMHINFRSFQFAFFKHFDMAHIGECGQFEWNSNIHPEKATKRWFLSQFFFSAEIKIKCLFDLQTLPIFKSNPFLKRCWLTFNTRLSFIDPFSVIQIFILVIFLLMLLYVVIENLKHCKICVFSFVNKTFDQKCNEIMGQNGSNT